MSGHEHAWGFAGRLPVRDSRRSEVGCEQPFLLACPCGRTAVAACGSARQRTCEPCGLKYRGRVTVKARSGMAADTVGTLGLFVTVTAPGSVAHRMPSGKLCPCTPVGGVDLGAWNAATCGQAGHWNRLKQAVARHVGTDLEYFRAVEVQRRGALHFHVLMRRRDGLPLTLSTASLRRLAVHHGFGHEVDVQPIRPGHAAYVAKYVGKAADYREEVPWFGAREVGGYERVDAQTGELVTVPRRIVPTLRPTYRTWTSSRRWGESMAAIRAAQRHYVLTLGELPAWGSRAGVPRSWACLPVPLRPDRPPEFTAPADGWQLA